MIKGEGLTVTACARRVSTTPDAAEAERRNRRGEAGDRRGGLHRGRLPDVRLSGPIPGTQNLKATRAAVLERLAGLAHYARAAGMRIALETPSHSRIALRLAIRASSHGGERIHAVWRVSRAQCACRLRAHSAEPGKPLEHAAAGCL